MLPQVTFLHEFWGLNSDPHEALDQLSHLEKFNYYWQSDSLHKILNDSNSGISRLWTRAGSEYLFHTKTLKLCFLELFRSKGSFLIFVSFICFSYGAWQFAISVILINIKFLLFQLDFESLMINPLLPK